MNLKILIFSLLLLACNNKEQKSKEIKVDNIETTIDTLHEKEIPAPDQETPVSKTYSNKRFRDVTVEKTGDNKFRIRGQGQIFEANFNWVVEDGHDELKKGYQMTDAGAPDWGNFDFTIDVQKERENSTLMLILFESSAKDGSRQHQLLITLE